MSKTAEDIAREIAEAWRATVISIPDWQTWNSEVKDGFVASIDKVIFASQSAAPSSYMSGFTSLGNGGFVAGIQDSPSYMDAIKRGVIASPTQTDFKSQGLCPSCGHSGEWINMALVCPEHGRFAG